MKVGFIGTGKLGGPVSEVMAESGNEVFAYDIAGGKNITQRRKKVDLESTTKLSRVLFKNLHSFYCCSYTS